VNFLATRRALFDMSVNERKCRGVHTKMSKVIKSRTSCQCRSHHQKMLVKYGTIDNVLREMKHMLTGKTLKELESSVDQT
jgi:hypothetical protein